MAWIPIPVELAGVLMMGGGALFWFFALFGFLEWIYDVRKSRPFTRWNSRKQGFEAVRPISQLGTLFLLFLLGLGFFTFGYLLFNRTLI